MANIIRAIPHDQGRPLKALLVKDTVTPLWENEDAIYYIEQVPSCDDFLLFDVVVCGLLYLYV